MVSAQRRSTTRLTVVGRRDVRPADSRGAEGADPAEEADF